MIDAIAASTATSTITAAVTAAATNTASPAIITTTTTTPVRLPSSSTELPDTAIATFMVVLMELYQIARLVISSFLVVTKQFYKRLCLSVCRKLFFQLTRSD